MRGKRIVLAICMISMLLLPVSINLAEGEGSLNYVDSETTMVYAIDGGSVTLDLPQGPVSISIPPNALSMDTDITIQRGIVDNPGEWDLDNDKSFASDIYDFGPDGTSFSQQVSIIIPYDNSNVYNPCSWTENQYAHANVYHFSRYAVLATVQDTNGENNGDGDGDGEGDGDSGEKMGFNFDELSIESLGHIGPIPVFYLGILILAIMIVVAIAFRKNNRTPPYMPRMQTPPTYPPTYPPQQATMPIQQQTTMPPPIPAPVPAPIPMGTQKAKPTKGKCGQCDENSLSFNDDGSGACNSCGHMFWWDKSKAPIEDEETFQEEAEDIHAQEEATPLVKEEEPPQEQEESDEDIECPQCGYPGVTTYPDGSHICGDCDHVW